MIRVENLTKHFGGVRAIEGVSFQVGKGEVVGFLGPNGAGKSTTMRILCGCIGATSGRALIGELDVLEKPREVKRKVGYLPEVPPLYGSMIVEDYVRFSAQIKGVDDPETAASKAISQVALESVRHRVVDHLSKGFRQRVGLAQALVNDPEVLVLDEPTSGLDPAQRKEIRDLLSDLAHGDRTVILSTHVLGEVEAICERVIIITEGRIVAEDSIAALAQTGHRVRLRIARPPDGFSMVLEGLAGVTGVHTQSDGAWEITSDADVREHLAQVSVPHGLLELAQTQRLEEAYLRLTSGGAA